MFKELFIESKLEEDFLSTVKKFLMKNSKRISKYFIDTDKNYGLKLPINVDIRRVFNDTLVHGYTTAIVKIKKEKGEILGIFEDSDDMDDGFRSYKKIDEFSDNIPTYYFKPRKG